ncbi:MAG TPA: hypothetical protein VGE47_14075 [Burkholderiaceae bacterium]
MSRTDMSKPVLPWWRVRMMWLVVLGPTAVVVASFVTLTLAIRGGDVPLQTATAKSRHLDAMTPAHQARNHAATPAR